MNKRVEKPERRFKVKEREGYNDNFNFNQACVQWEAFHQQEIARLEVKYDKLSKLRDDEMARHISEVARLEKEVDKIERALRIESQEPEERSQEANHYNWLDDELEKECLERLKVEKELARIKGISVEELYLNIGTAHTPKGSFMLPALSMKVARQIHNLIQGEQT